MLSCYRYKISDFCEVIGIPLTVEYSYFKRICGYIIFMKLYPQYLPIYMGTCYILVVDHIFSPTQDNIPKSHNTIEKNKGVRTLIDLSYIHRLCPHFTKFDIIEV